MGNKLYRTRNNKYIGGVCGGLAEYLDIDPTFTRLIFLLMGFMSAGVVTLIYIIMCFVLPYKDELVPYESRTSSGYDKDVQDNTGGSDMATRKIIGIVLIVVGCLLLVRKILPLNIAKYIFPLTILVIGLILVISAVTGEKTVTDEQEISEEADSDRDIPEEEYREDIIVPADETENSITITPVTEEESSDDTISQEEENVSNESDTKNPVPPEETEPGEITEIKEEEDINE